MVSRRARSNWSDLNAKGWPTNRRGEGAPPGWPRSTRPQSTYGGLDQEKPDFANSALWAAARGTVARGPRASWGSAIDWRVRCVLASSKLICRTLVAEDGAHGSAEPIQPQRVAGPKVAQGLDEDRSVIDALLAQSLGLKPGSKDSPWKLLGPPLQIIRAPPLAASDSCCSDRIQQCGACGYELVCRAVLGKQMAVHVRAIDQQHQPVGDLVGVAIARHTHKIREAGTEFPFVAYGDCAPWVSRIWKLCSDVDEGAATVSRAGCVLLDPLEMCDKLSVRVANEALRDLIPIAPVAFVIAVEHSCNQVVLRCEVVVQGRLCDARLLDDEVDSNRPGTVLIEKFAGGIQDALTRR